MGRTTSLQPSLFSWEDDPAAATSFGDEPAEHYRVDVKARMVVRAVRTRSGEIVESRVPCDSIDPRIGTRDPAAAFDASWLRLKTRPESGGARGVRRVVDLFSGAGGLSVGLDEAGRALELEIRHVMGADIEQEALKTYERNFHPEVAEARPVEQVVDSGLGAALSSGERALRRLVGEVDLVVGGPPCQGHSNLNNHTRRRDPKNALYDRMARFAEVVGPKHVVIENVPGVRHDVGKVFDRTLTALVKLGYRVDALKVNAEDLGVPQRRHRAVIVASTAAPVGEGFLRSIARRFTQPMRSVGWAIGDLVDLHSTHPIDAVTVLTEESQRRIDWLFANDEHDLPNELRPDCHRTKEHTYKSVYGRLFWDQPSWTITTGFQVMGQGRFVHPTRPRVITSHEAARLQFFPDFFDFGITNRKGYAKMIGNAVPSKLAYVLGVELFR